MNTIVNFLPYARQDDQYVISRLVKMKIEKLKVHEQVVNVTGVSTSRVEDKNHKRDKNLD